MATYELIALDEATPQLLAPTSTDTGKVVGNFEVDGTSLLDTISISTGSITCSSGTINFGDENLTTTGVITGGSVANLVIGTDVQAWDTQLDDIAALAVTDGNIIVGDGANWVAESGATARTSLGATTVGEALFTAASVAAAQQAIDVEVGVDVQAYDADNAVKDVAQEYTATQNFNATTLTSTTNAVAWDASANQVVSHTLTENTTFSAPTNLVDGAFYSLAIIQDSGASGYTVAFNSVFKFIGGAAPTWTTTASARDYISFRSDGTNLYEVGHALAVA